MKQQVTIHLDSDVVALIDAKCKKDSTLSRSAFINDVMVRYFKKTLSDGDPAEVDMISIGNDIASIVEMCHHLYRNIAYNNHLINGGVPIFDTNTTTKVFKPTDNLKKEARRKMMLGYARLLKGEMTKEDYFQTEDESEE